MPDYLVINAREGFFFSLFQPLTSSNSPVETTFPLAFKPTNREMAINAGMKLIRRHYLPNGWLFIQGVPGYFNFDSNESTRGFINNRPNGSKAKSTIMAYCHSNRLWNCGSNIKPLSKIKMFIPSVSHTLCKQLPETKSAKKKKKSVSGNFGGLKQRRQKEKGFSCH